MMAARWTKRVRPRATAVAPVSSGDKTPIPTSHVPIGLIIIPGRYWDSSGGFCDIIWSCHRLLASTTSILPTSSLSATKNRLLAMIAQVSAIFRQGTFMAPPAGSVHSSRELASRPRSVKHVKKHITRAVPELRPGETPDQAAERRLRESERVEERVKYIESIKELQCELKQVGQRHFSSRGRGFMFRPSRPQANARRHCCPHAFPPPKRTGWPH